MSDTDGFVATFKAGKDYSAPWLVVHAPDAASLDAQLNDVTVDLLARIGGISEVFQNLAAGGSAAPQASAGGALSSQPAQAAPQSAPPAASPPYGQQQPQGAVSTPPQQNEAPLRFHPEGKKCSVCGGSLYYQQWVSKANKTCKAYKCDGKGMGHDLEWAS